MLKLLVKYADSWNAFWEHVDNCPAGYARIKPIIDKACEEGGRDPTNLERTVTLLVADENADPWWEDMPFEQDTAQRLAAL